MRKEFLSRSGWRVVHGPVEEAAARAHLAAAFEKAKGDDVVLRGLSTIQVWRLPEGMAELVAPPISREDEMASRT